MAYVEVLDETRRFGRTAELRRLLTRYFEEAGLDAREVTVVIVDDDAIAVRNLRDRGVQGATDVLSYPTMEPDDVGFPPVPHLGDVFVSLDTAARQADALGHDAFTEVAVLTLHGVTHLRGLDHRDEAEWTPFRQAEERARALAMGLPPRPRGSGTEHA